MAETIKKSGTNTINVSMQSGESLSEVVVQTNFGYFSKDSRLLSSVSTVSADEIARQSPALTIQNALQGQAAVQVTGSNGKPEQQLSLQFVEP
jgi:outer membrane receptor for ferrienterochelin and colicin